MIKFNKHNVRNTETNAKARVHYSVTTDIKNRKAVFIYAKDYGHALRNVMPEAYENNTDTMTDYFETGTVRLYEGDNLYEAALARATA